MCCETASLTEFVSTRRVSNGLHTVDALWLCGCDLCLTGYSTLDWNVASVHSTKILVTKYMRQNSAFSVKNTVETDVGKSRTYTNFICFL